MASIVNDNILLLDKSFEFKEHLINEGFKGLSVLNKPIQSNSISIPPTNPNVDDFYIVPITGSGAWTNKENQIAYPAVNNSGEIVGWKFYIPEEGTYAYVLNVGFKAFDGTEWNSTLQPFYASYIFQTPEAINTTIYLTNIAKFEHTITGAFFRVETGTCVVTIYINETPITGLSNITVTNSTGEFTATALNIVNLGDQVTAIVSSNDNAVQLRIEAFYSYRN